MYRYDTSSVTTMSSMFRDAVTFNQPINQWNTSSVEYMDSMFYGAATFNHIIGKWDTSSVTTGCYVT